MTQDVERYCTSLAWLLIFTIVLVFTSSCQAEETAVPNSLIALAAVKFLSLTSAERAMLWFSDVDNVDRGDFALAGSNANPADPSNSPAHADSWPTSREIRAALIRWICVDHQAQRLLDPKGIRVLGARITGKLDLALVNVPIPIVLDNCVFSAPIDLTGATLPELELDGSSVRQIHASGLIVRNNLSMVGATLGTVSLDHAKMGLDLSCAGAKLRYTKNPDEPFLARTRATLYAYLIQVGGNVWLNRGFESDGAVNLGGARINGNLHFDSGRFTNPNNVAISAPGASIDGVIYLARFGSDGDAIVTGLANFSSDKIADSFIVDHASFLGARGSRHGFVGTGMSVGRTFVWQNVTLQSDAILDLNDASVGTLLDDEQSWPAPGLLNIDGFIYNSLSAEIGDRAAQASASQGDDRNSVDSRLRWLALQPPGFHSQPYSELAKYYENSGEEVSAVIVHIAGEDDRYSRLGTFGRLWGGVLKATIGYGHKPLLAFNWSVLIVIIGWVAVGMGKQAGVMRLTWPENSPPPSGDQNAGLHPLLYSLDVFLPFVDLHQQRYWWPDEALRGECKIAGRKTMVSGSILRIYLWLQIIAGWLLSAIFVAGITGIIRSD